VALLLVSFIAGAITVLAPCILPLLPVALGGGAAGDRLRPVRIVGALALSVFAFTFLLKASTALLGVPEAFWKGLSAAAVAALGLSLLLPRAWAGIVSALGLRSGGSRLMAKGYRHRAAWWGDALVGLSLGPVFTTCSPTYFFVLATVLPSSPALGALYVAAYVLGLAAALLAVAWLGARLVARLGGAANPDGWLKRSFGLLLILTAAAIATGADKALEAAIIGAGWIDVPALERGVAGWIDSSLGLR
jgi:cytochrome c-type biogenesis protein